MTVVEDRPGTETEATRQLGTATSHFTSAVLGYACTAQLYRDAGWSGVLPLPPGQKFPPPAGFTGRDGAWPTGEQITEWCRDADANLALRVNHGVIGIDVDAYDGKTGGATIEEAQKLWGPLPATYRSSSRSEDAASGIRVFRVPEGVEFQNGINFGDLSHVDIVQFHQRYITAWPSVHPNTGARYQWYRPDGVVGGVPRVDDLPELPAEWVKQLRRYVRDEVFDGSAPNRTAAQRAKINEERYQQLIALPDNGSPDPVVAKLLDRAVGDLISGGSRYDTTRDRVGALMRLHAVGRVGVPAALAQLGEVYVLEVADTRPDGVARAEFLRFTEGAAALVATTTSKANPDKGSVDIGSGDWSSLVTDGASFILDIPDEIPALWGTGQRVLWAEGESLMIFGATGLGKTTLAGMLVRAQLGVGRRKFSVAEDVLGLPVRQIDGKILYLAMDRPSQARRSLHRQFSDCEREVLRDRLVVWKGPPPGDIAANPQILTDLAERFDASVVYLDSVKDAALGLADDAVGAAYNRARQKLLSRGIQLVELHHVKKDQKGDITDAYGSGFLTSGAGSVVKLTGETGDQMVKFEHMKQPAETVGPLSLSHDKKAGIMTVLSDTDPVVALAEASGEQGISAKEVAEEFFGSTSKNDVQKARDKLKKLTNQGTLRLIKGQRGGSGGGIPDRWVVS
jgi:hypothetical protein